MIIKGKSRPVAGTLASYIVQKKQNGLVSVKEIRGTVSQNVKDALQEMEAISTGTKCKSFLYHASINPQEHEHLTPEQWERAAEILEKELKLEGHQRVTVEHFKGGRAHRHFIWNRINPDTLKAVHMSGSYAAHERAARQIEREFGLERVQGVHVERDQGEVPRRGPKSWEMERGKRTGLDPRKITAEVSALWNESKDGKSFVAAIKERGYLLAHGDKRDFILIDQAGNHHNMTRRTGARAVDVREKLADVERASLPTVEQAKAIQKERFEQRGKDMPERERDRQTEERKKAARLDDERREQYFQGEEERRQQYFKEEEIKRGEFRAQLDKQESLAREMQEQEHRLNAYRAGLARQAEEARREEERRREADDARRAREGEIRDAGNRYGQALGRHYDIKDPYGSLARSAMEEYRTFLQDRENLDRKIAKAEDPNERQALELRKRIEAAEYMAITSNRIAGQTEVIGGTNSKESAARERARAEAFQNEAKELRAEWRELQGHRTHGGEGRAQEAPRAEAVRESAATAQHEQREQAKPPRAGRRGNFGQLKAEQQKTPDAELREREAAQLQRLASREAAPGRDPAQPVRPTQETARERERREAWETKRLQAERFANEQREKNQAQEKAPRQEPQAQAKTQQNAEQEKRGREEQARAETQKTQPRRDPVQEKKAEQAARTEQTDAKQAKSSADQARDVWNRRAKGESRGGDDRERERER
jgi:hypothetical protein